MPERKTDGNAGREPAGLKRRFSGTCPAECVLSNLRIREISDVSLKGWNHKDRIMYSFFATIARMKYIERWALMRSSRPENLSEHALEVASIAHVLCTIGNLRYGRHLDADRAAMLGMYHDATEIITGDMPTPVKYYSRDIRQAYHSVEEAAAQKLLHLLPQDLQPVYEGILLPEKSPNAPTEDYLRRLVKAADKLSALIKCMEEENAGNAEFRTARQTIQTAVDAMAADLPEVKDFCEDFLPAYGSTLDELL